MSSWSTQEQALAACADRAFTPGKHDFHELLALLATVERDDAKAIVSALARAGAASATSALSALPGAQPPLRARLIEVIGRVAQHAPAPQWHTALVTAATDSDPTTARKAIVILGKLDRSHKLPTQLEKILIARLQDAPAALQRAIIETLGKKGSEASLKFVTAHAAVGEEDKRVQSRAALMLQRTHQRSKSHVVLNVRLPQTMRVALECRVGLARLLTEEVQSPLRKIRAFADRVEFDHAGDLQSLLTARIALDIALLAPLARSGADLEQRVVDALKQEHLQGALRAWTDGTPRFRVSWQGGGHRRAATWRVAKLTAEQVPQLNNDPAGACWECRICDLDAHPHIALVPKLSPDPRFAFRKADVPAASHPTIAAALALQAAPTKNDIVWDPFVGSGLELIEVARRSNVKALHGSDIDPRALAAARSNLHAAHLSEAQLQVGDARSYRVRNVSLIISNPPMGRRVARDGALLGLLDDFLHNARQCLSKGGRVVWLSPSGEHTARTAKRLGFTVQRFEAVDLGGFSAELQVLRH